MRTLGLSIDVIRAHERPPRHALAAPLSGISPAKHSLSAYIPVYLCCNPSGLRQWIGIYAAELIKNETHVV